MDKLVLALAPAFTAGFALQQLLEVLDPIMVKLISSPKQKKLVLGLISLIVGLVLALGGGLRVLQPLGFAGSEAYDVLVTGLVISAGTEGVNSILKFLGYAKDNQKAQSARQAAQANDELPLVDRQPGRDIAAEPLPAKR